MSIERTLQGIDIRFHETARIDPERIVELVGKGERITFAPPATLRLRTAGVRVRICSQTSGICCERSPSTFKMAEGVFI